MNADSQDNKIRSRFFGPQNAQFDTSPLICFNTNEKKESKIILRKECKSKRVEISFHLIITA